MTFRPIYRAAVPAAVLAATLGLAASAQAASSGHAAATAGTKITMKNGPFGHYLTVGSGPFKGFSLYFITSDNPPSYGCTTGATSTPIGPITCTGPSTDKKAEWPAITTVGAPVAGRGVNPSLLGEVHRKGVGDQITYAGHPLYLFDQSPLSITGEGWFEPGLPPWHGIWWLMSPGGSALPWGGTLTSTRIPGGKTVLAEQYMTGDGWVNFPVYTFSGDKQGMAVCSANASCALAWPPVLTSGNVGSSGIPPGNIGELGIGGNLTQVSWSGKPLYLFSNEQLKLLKDGQPRAVGSGRGIKAFGGKFRLVVKP